MGQDMIPQSLVTKSLNNLVHELNGTVDIVQAVRSPMTDFSLVIAQIDEYIAKGRRAFGIIDNFLNGIDKLLFLCSSLGRYIPEVGPILASVARTIRGSKIISSGRSISERMKKLLTNNTTVKDIKKGSAFVQSHLESLANGIPHWTNTVDILGKFSLATDFCLEFIAKPLLEKDFKDLQGHVEATLTEIFGNLPDKIKPIKDAIGSIDNFIKNVWTGLSDSITTMLREGFGSVIDDLTDLQRKVGQVIGVLDPISDAINAVTNAPVVKQVWGFFNWVIDNTVGRLSDLVLDLPGIRDVVGELTDKFNHIFHIDELESKLMSLFNTQLDSIKSSLSSFFDTSIAKDIQNNVSQFAEALKEFNKNPADLFLTVVQKIASVKIDYGPIPDDVQLADTRTKRLEALNVAFANSPTLPVVVQEAGTPPIPTVDKPVLNETEQDEVSKVYGTQKRITDYLMDSVLQPIPEPAHSVHLRMAMTEDTPTPRQATPTNHGNAPMLGYAYFNDEPVSVLMRLQQKPIVNKIQDLGKPVEKLVIPPKPAVQASKAAVLDDKWSSSFKTFVKSYTESTDQIAATKARLDQLKEPARKVDLDFARYSSGAIDFAGHFFAMLNALDPVTAASKDLLALFLSLQAPLNSGLSRLIQWLGLPDLITQSLHYFFEAVAGAKTSVEQFQQLKGEVGGLNQNLTNSYREFHDAVVRICSKEPFLNTRESGDSNLSTLIEALQRWTNVLGSSLSLLKSLGDTVFQQKENLSADSEQVLHLLDEAYLKLTDIVKHTINSIKSLSDQVETLFTTLTAMHSDVRTFFMAVEKLHNRCSDVETKVIAASRINVLCSRVDATIEPFKELIYKLGVLGPDVGPVDGKTALAQVAQAASSQLSIPQSVNSIRDIATTDITLLLGAFFHLPELKAEMIELETSLKTPLNTDLTSFNQQLKALIKLVEPKKIVGYALPPAKSSPNSALPGFLVPNPLLDDSTAKDFGMVFEEIIALLHKLKRKDGSAISPTLPNGTTEVIHDKSEKGIKFLFLLSWGPTWDEADKAHPSQVFINWYSLLESLDRLINSRQTWQRLDANAKLVQDAPAALSGSALELWKALEVKATIGGSTYRANIEVPLKKPLHDRIDRLLDGFVQLPAEQAANDILRLLPAAKEGENTKKKTLPPSAQELFESAFVDKKIPEDLAQVMDERAQIEEVVADLVPLLDAAASFLSSAKVDVGAAIKTVNDIYDDYSLMVARKFLELKGDESAAKKFVELAGASDRLKQ